MSGVPLRPGWFSYNWLTGTGMQQQGGNTLSTYSGGVGAEPTGPAGTQIKGMVTSGSPSGTVAGAVAQVTQAVTEALSTPTGWLVIAAGVLVLMGGGKHVKH